jgi:hypothetical protein
MTFPFTGVRVAVAVDVRVAVNVGVAAGRPTASMERRKSIIFIQQAPQLSS